MTCFIPSVHDVEHTVPTTGDVCGRYVVCITTCLCMQDIQCFDCVSGADVCVGCVYGMSVWDACACKPYNALIVCLGLMSVWDVCMGCLYGMLVHASHTML